MSIEVIKPGKFVSLTYHITDLDGNVLEQNDIPVSYVHGGETELIGGMDRLIAGKGVGDRVEMTVPPENGFGDYDPELTFTDDIANVPPQFHHVGAEVQMENRDGDSRTFYVSKIEGDKLTVDGNHPMAGKTLKVMVKIVEVRDATPEDMNPPPDDGESCTVN